MEKVGYVHSSPVGNMRANSSHVVAMCRAIKSLDLDLDLVVPFVDVIVPLPEDIIPDVIQSKLYFKYIPNKFRHFLFVCLYFWKFSGKTIITRYFFLMVVSVFSKKNVIFDIHMLPCDMGYIYDLVFKFYLRFSKKKHIVAISFELKKRLQEKYDKDLNVRVAHDAANPILKEDMKKKWCSDEVKIGFVGSLSYGKGFETFVYLANHFPNANFIACGDSSSIDISAMPKNIFFKGFLYGDELRLAYADIKIALIPSRADMITYSSRSEIGSYNSPLKLFEAMANGCACIVSDLPNLREVLDDKSALFVDPGEYNEWLVNLKKLYGDFNKQKEMAYLAQEKVKKIYTWPKRVENMLSLVE